MIKHECKDTMTKQHHQNSKMWGGGNDEDKMGWRRVGWTWTQTRRTNNDEDEETRRSIDRKRNDKLRNNQFRVLFLFI